MLVFCAFVFLHCINCIQSKAMLKKKKKNCHTDVSVATHHVVVMGCCEVIWPQTVLRHQREWLNLDWSLTIPQSGPLIDMFWLNLSLYSWMNTSEHNLQKPSVPQCKCCSALVHPLRCISIKATEWKKRKKTLHSTHLAFFTGRVAGVEWQQRKKQTYFSLKIQKNTEPER